MHLHIGLAPKSLNRFFRSLSSASDRTNGRVAYTIDGDGWNVWGEGVDVNGNDPSTLHVIIHVYTEEQANEVLALGPAFVKHKDGFDALLTAEDNWGVVYQSFPDNVPGQVPNVVLKHLLSLREAAIGLANEFSGPDVSRMIGETEEAYDVILAELQNLYQERDEKKTLGFVQNVILGNR